MTSISIVAWRRDNTESFNRSIPAEQLFERLGPEIAYTNI